MESLNSAALTNPEQAIKGLPPYSAVEALQRLQTLQRVCATLSLDGILFVGGVDGKHHEASHEVLAWLLNGESGRVVFGRGSGGVDMEEVVLVITPTAARLYCPAAIWQALAPRLGLWPRYVAPPPAPPSSGGPSSAQGPPHPSAPPPHLASLNSPRPVASRLQVHSPAASLEEAEVLEEHKIRAFIAMLEGLQAVGIPLPEQGDAKPIEQWPLVQAYALQDFEALTGGGFLTQRLRCVTCAAAVVAPLALVDARALHWLVRVEAPRLRGCWEECERGLDQACGARPLRASEGTLCEAPLTYADYGRLRPPKLGLLNPRTGRLPLEPLARTRLLLGTRTALCEGGEPCSTISPPYLAHISPISPPYLAHISPISAPGEPCSTEAPGGGGQGACEASPRHLILEAAEPHGPLYAGRVYFLGLGAAAPPSAPVAQPEKIVEDGAATLRSHPDPNPDPIPDLSQAPPPSARARNPDPNQAPPPCVRRAPASRRRARRRRRRPRRRARRRRTRAPQTRSCCRASSARCRPRRTLGLGLGLGLALALGLALGLGLANPNPNPNPNPNQAAVDEVVEAHGVGATAATLGEEVAAAVARRAAAAGLATPAGWSPRVAVQRQLVDLLGIPREDGAAAGLVPLVKLLLKSLLCRYDIEVLTSNLDQTEDLSA